MSLLTWKLSERAKPTYLQKIVHNIRRGSFISNKWIIFYWQDLYHGGWEIFLSLGKYLEFTIKWNKED